MKKLFMIRRVDGDSMLPSVLPGTIVIGWCVPRQLHRGDVVILSHNGIEKIKRISNVDGNMLFTLGDNHAASTDSRHFGWIDRSQVLGLVIWPRLVPVRD